MTDSEDILIGSSSSSSEDINPIKTIPEWIVSRDKVKNTLLDKIMTSNEIRDLSLQEIFNLYGISTEYPTPEWFFWTSERELLAQEAEIKEQIIKDEIFAYYINKVISLIPQRDISQSDLIDALIKIKG